jgi:hypothetical protein
MRLHGYRARIARSFHRVIQRGARSTSLSPSLPRSRALSSASSPAGSLSCFHGARRNIRQCRGVLAKLSVALGRLRFTRSRLASPHLASPRLASPRLASPRLASPHLTSPHLTSPHLTSPRLTSPHLTSPHLTAPRLSACLPACLPACLLACLPCLPAWLPSLLVCVFARNVGISLRVLDATRLRGSPNGRENWKEGNARNVTKLRRGSDKEERSASGSKARTRYAAKSVDERDAGPRRQAAPNRSLRLPRLTAPVLSTRGDRERRR